MRYQVFTLYKSRYGPFWRRRTKWTRTGNHLSTNDRDSALRFAESYRYWADSMVIVSAGYEGWIFIKRGDRVLQDDIFFLEQGHLQ